MSFIEQQAKYAEEQALVFQDIDYLGITYRVLRKDYMHLTRCLVPLGDQIGKSPKELSDMLRTKTRRFTENEIQTKFRRSITK